jgi:hypothetical protein
MKPILVIDFDGVLHSYASGWKGVTTIPDPPVPGALDFLARAVACFDVQIFSSRSNQHRGIPAMQDWLKWHATRGRQEPPEWLEAIGWPTDKPAAFVTLDDRAVTFNGVWPDLEELAAFRTWQRR